LTTQNRDIRRKWRKTALSANGSRRESRQVLDFPGLFFPETKKPAGELRVGPRTEEFRGRELPDEDKVPILRAYLKRWKVEVGVFFDGVGPDSSDEQILAIAGRHPAFEVLPTS